VTVYAESSAVVAWLFGEAGGEAVRQALASADRVVASDLTLVECDRVLIRAQVAHAIPEARMATLRARLNAAATHWTLLRLERDVVERARRPFPGEPIRTLDALHLASALVARAALERLDLLSLDQRIRASALQLGFTVLPA
jgi:predicted nucleic acid-binding protein